MNKLEERISKLERLVLTQFETIEDLREELKKHSDNMEAHKI